MSEQQEPVLGQDSIAKSDIVSIKTLELWDKNPRSIKTDRFNELKERLKRQGQIKPLLIAADGKTVIGGNMRLRAMKELGINEAWVSHTEAKTDKEIFDLALTDNEEFGYYEQEQVAELALELGLSPLELKSYALSLGEPTTLDLVLDKFQPTPEEDEVPEVDEDNEPESRLGEIYQLGNHRLMCGDATDIDAITELMDGAKADMVFTDPPYGVSYQSNMRTQSDKFAVIENDDKLITEWIAPVCSVSSGFIFIWTSWKVLGEWLDITQQIGQMTNMIIWDKGGGGIGDLEGTYSSDYEVALVFNRGAKLTGKRLGSVWSIGKDAASVYEHPTQKPAGLAATAIKTVSKQGDIVLDVFGGSGSTLIACEQTNRTCYMMELDPKYCDVIRKRYANHIGEGDNWIEATPVVSEAKELINASR
jgi:DNA modification methylase